MAIQRPETSIRSVSLWSFRQFQVVSCAQHLHRVHNITVLLSQPLFISTESLIISTSATMKRKNRLSEYDATITEYYNRDRLQRELNDFYNYTSAFRNSHDTYENPMHTYAYDIVDDDTVEYDENGWTKGNPYLVTPSPSPQRQSSVTHNKYKNHDSPDTSAMSSDYCSEDTNNDKNISYEQSLASKTMSSTVDSFLTTPQIERGKGSNGSSPEHHFLDGISRGSVNTGVSHGSETSSISDLKFKKRMIERSIERRFNRFPRLVTKCLN